MGRRPCLCLWRLLPGNGGGVRCYWAGLGETRDKSLGSSWTWSVSYFSVTRINTRTEPTSGKNSWFRLMVPQGEESIMAGGGMGARSWPSSKIGKPRGHITVIHIPDAERVDCKGGETLNSQIPLLAMCFLYWVCITSWDSATNWGPTLQRPEPIGDISLSSHHMTTLSDRQGDLLSPSLFLMSPRGWNLLSFPLGSHWSCFRKLH